MYIYVLSRTWLAGRPFVSLRVSIRLECLFPYTISVWVGIIFKQSKDERGRGFM
jgi:hypothetical protein